MQKSEPYARFISVRPWLLLGPTIFTIAKSQTIKPIPWTTTIRMIVLMQLNNKNVLNYTLKHQHKLISPDKEEKNKQDAYKEIRI